MIISFGISLAVVGQSGISYLQKEAPSVINAFQEDFPEKSVRQRFTL